MAGRPPGLPVPAAGRGAARADVLAAGALVGSWTGHAGAAAVAGRWDEAERIRRIFEPLEDLRNAISPIRVLHEAVAAAGVADTGPLLPLLDGVAEAHRPAIATAARALLAANGPG